MNRSATRLTPAAVAAGGALTVLALLFLSPSLWLVVAAFDPDATLDFAVPGSPSLANFREIASWESLGRPLLNSLGISVLSSTITAVCAFLAGYPLSRYRLRYGRAFLYLILIGSGLPVIALMVPIYTVLANNNLIDSQVVTAVFLATTGLPFSIWLAKNFIDAVPKSVEEAAVCDGASTWQIMTRIVLPLVRPGLAVIVIFTFIGNWGNFFVPFLLLLSPEKQTASVSLYNFFTSFGGIFFGQLAAYSLLYSLPAMVLYSIISRTIGRSFAFAGAVKE